MSFHSTVKSIRNHSFCFRIVKQLDANQQQQWTPNNVRKAPSLVFRLFWRGSIIAKRTSRKADFGNNKDFSFTLSFWLYDVELPLRLHTYRPSLLVFTINSQNEFRIWFQFFSSCNWIVTLFFCHWFFKHRT